MKFWAIAYKYQEGVFFNIAQNKDDMDITSEYLLPAKFLAEHFIEEELSSDYAPIEIEIESLSKQGVMVYSRGELVGYWD